VTLVDKHSRRQHRQSRCIDWCPQGRPLQPRTFTAPPLFVFHHANAYESPDGRHVSVDSIHYDSLPAVGREALAEQQARGIGGRGVQAVALLGL
jgi:carotenoid cleavage dioxygenase-like enzyme